MSYGVIILFKEIVDRTPVGRPELWKFKPRADYKPGDLRKAWEIDFGNGFKKPVATFTGKNQSIVDANSYTLGNPIIIRNLTEYAEIIEFGNHSRQAPEGMVRVSLLKFNQFLKTAVKNNKV